MTMQGSFLFDQLFVVLCLNSSFALVVCETVSEHVEMGQRAV